MKVCPFCVNDLMSFNSYHGEGWIECDVCGSHGPHNVLAEIDFEASVEKAATDWNKRYET